jgi:nucleotide-binding universal stress UspA family protein
MYRMILVPLDGSKFAESALPLALSVSRRTASGLHLSTVQEPVPSFAYDEWENAAAEWSQQYLASVLDRVGPHAGGSVTMALLSGHVAEVLEEEAKEKNADLVVMATHGRGLLSRAWLGSVADSFLHHTERPVLVVRPEDDDVPRLEADPSFDKILIPLDGTELSECMLEHAVEFGRLFDAAYHLVRVVPYPIDIASPYLPHTVQLNQGLVDDAKVAATEYLHAQAESLTQQGLTVDTAVLVDAQPGHGILKEVEAAGCDLIAMSTHGRKGLSRAILGSAADKVLRGTHVPVLLYRPGD